MRRATVILFIICSILVSATLCLAQEELFTGDSDISPPKPPAEAEVEEGLTINLIDIETGKCLRDMHVKIELQNRDSGERVTTIRYFEGCNASLDIPPGNWLLTLKADNLSTGGKDFYGDMSVTYLNASRRETVDAYMKPAGSVRGEVLDEGERVVVDARIKFECSSDYGVQDPAETDEYGSFRAEWLPTGSCRISALYMGRVGSTDVAVEEGRLKEVSIRLEKATTAGFMDYTPYILLVFVFFAAIYVVYRVRRHSTPYGVSEEKKPLDASKGMQSLMETLTDEQGNIIRELLKAGGRLTQADICYKTGIPKASVSRYISYLESRKILETTRIGRLKEVRLSKWFLAR